MSNQNIDNVSFTNPVVPVYEFFDSYGVGLIESENKSDASNVSISATDIKAKVLKIISDNPMSPSSEYPKLAGISPNTFQKIRKLLLEEGLIDERKFQMAGRGRSRLVLVLTQKGEGFLKNCGNAREVN